MKTLLCFTLSFAMPIVALFAEEPASGRKTERVAFAQYCFWTGEMKLGQIEGVIRTEAGHFRGREVTLVNYDPARISLEILTKEAKLAGVADRVHLPLGTNTVGPNVAGVPVGVPLDQSYRTAPASDQKKQIEGTPFAALQLTPEQATKVNAFVRSNPAKAMAWLPAEQRAKMATTQ